MAIAILDQYGSILSQVAVDEHAPERVTLVTTQDVTGIVDYCHEKSLESTGSDMKHVAEIPMAVVERMMQDGSWNDQAAVKRWLNDPDNRAFRIWQGKV